MKKFIKITLWVLVAIAAAVVVIGFLAPKKYDITRSVLIQANRATVWEQVSLWKNINNWSPWYKMDTTMHTKIDGTDGEVGAKYSWESGKMGKGSQTILEVKPMDYRQSDLIMGWGGKSLVTYNLKDSAGGTFVTWRMWGENGFLGSIFMFFLGMEDNIGKDFESGLANLKKICESKPPYKLGDITTSTFEKRIFAAKKYAISMDEFEKNSKAIFGQSAGELMAYIQKNKLQITGGMFALYYVWDDKNRKVEMEVAFPVNKEAMADGDIHTTSVKEMNSAVVDFWGPYEQSGQAHMAMDKWFQANHKESGTPVMEEYIIGPEREKDAMKWQTRVWYPIK